MSEAQRPTDLSIIHSPDSVDAELLEVDPNNSRRKKQRISLPDEKNVGKGTWGEFPKPPRQTRQRKTQRTEHTPEENGVEGGSLPNGTSRKTAELNPKNEMTVDPLTVGTSPGDVCKTLSPTPKAAIESAKLSGSSMPNTIQDSAESTVADGKAKKLLCLNRRSGTIG